MWQRFRVSKFVVFLSGMAAGAITAPLLGRAARPLVRQAIKGGIVARQEIMRIVEGMREELEDIAAEARSELGQEPAPHHHGHGHTQKEAKA